MKNDGDVLQDGDDFELNFLPSYAIGMYFITTGDTEGEMYDDDITLSAGGGSVGLDAGALVDLGSDWQAYFLGIVDNAHPLTKAKIATVGGGYFLYNVDDITTSPVPEPGTFLLVGVGLAGLACTRRRQRLP